MTDAPSHEDGAIEAAEYALGLLSAEEIADFEARLATSPTLRDALSEWREHLAQTTDAIPTMPPPPHLYRGITDRLFTEEQPRRWVLPRFMEVSLGAVAAAFFAFGALFFVQANMSEPDTMRITEISAADGSLTLVASYRAGATAVKIEREDGAPIEGRAHELWLIIAGEPPVSLGVMPANQVASFAIPADLRDRFVGATLAISDEPEGGSPTGAPTGAVLATAIVEGAN